eukprot:TRINITY_DN76108_c0_g1_i1.p1 TRINITY_DN76108_c0_g1~~TRINITY_DN76108_c0_g1_i1.p1  ORF type:complete len:518 (-),score=51.19 TRINITY_DN76108_c0_g1_i1:82-1635(-)
MWFPHHFCILLAIARRVVSVRIEIVDESSLVDHYHTKNYADASESSLHSPTVNVNRPGKQISKAEVISAVLNKLAADSPNTSLEGLAQEAAAIFKGLEEDLSPIANEHPMSAPRVPDITHDFSAVLQTDSFPDQNPSVQPFRSGPFPQSFEPNMPFVQGNNVPLEAAAGSSVAPMRTPEFATSMPVMQGPYGPLQSGTQPSMASLRNPESEASVSARQANRLPLQRLTEPPQRKPSPQAREELVAAALVRRQPQSDSITFSLGPSNQQGPQQIRNLEESILQNQEALSMFFGSGSDHKNTSIESPAPLSVSEPDIREAVDAVLAVDLTQRFMNRDRSDQVLWRQSYDLDLDVYTAFRALSVPNLLRICHPTLLSLQGASRRHPVEEGYEFQARAVSQGNGALLQRIVVGKMDPPTRMLFHSATVLTAEGAPKVDDLRNIGKSFQHTLKPTPQGTTIWTLISALYNVYPSTAVVEKRIFARLAEKVRARTLVTDALFAKCVQDMLHKNNWEAILQDHR